MKEEGLQAKYEEPTMETINSDDDDDEKEECSSCQTTCTVGNQICRPINQ